MINFLRRYVPVYRSGPGCSKADKRQYPIKNLPMFSSRLLKMFLKANFELKVKEVDK